jgi:hypothetical protein
MSNASTAWYPVEVEQESVNRAKKRKTDTPKVGALPDPEANAFARDLDRLLKGKMQFGTEAEKSLAQSLHSSLINYLKRKP